MPYLFSALTRVSTGTSIHLRDLLEEPRLIERLRRGDRVSSVHPSLSKAVAKLDWKGCEEEDRRAEERGVRILPWGDPRYPEGLRHIPSPPPALYALGRVDALAQPSVAVVGSRLSTVYGQNVARMLAQDLALAGLGIVSGLARGIDTAAHEGSLAAPGRAVAILGTGIDVPYPRENEGLMRRILERDGVAATEFAPGTPPAPRNFPLRNRVVSALSWGVVVVEATERSGALITARFALETGREVFAVPHNITSRTGVGPNTLIQKGARLVQQARDVLDELPEHFRCMLQPIASSSQEKDAVATLSHEARLLAGVLRADDGAGMDALCAATGLPAHRALAGLLDLQMAGLCVELPGARYALNRPVKEST